MNLYPYPQKCPHTMPPPKFEALKHGCNLSLSEKIMLGVITSDEVSLKIQGILNKKFALLENKIIGDLRIFIESALKEEGIKFCEITIPESPYEPCEIVMPTQIRNDVGVRINFKATPLNPSVLADMGIPLRFGSGERKFPQGVAVTTDEFKTEVGCLLVSVSLLGRDVEKVRARLIGKLNLGKNDFIPEFQADVIDSIFKNASESAKQLIDDILNSKTRKVLAQGGLQLMKSTIIDELNACRSSHYLLIEKCSDSLDGIQSLRNLKNLYSTLIEDLKKILLGSTKDDHRAQQIAAPFEAEVRFLEEAICYLNPRLPEVKVADDNRYVNYARYLQTKMFLFDVCNYLASENIEFRCVFGKEYRVSNDEPTYTTFSTKRATIEHAITIFTSEAKPQMLTPGEFQSAPLPDDLLPHAYGFAFYSHQLHDFLKKIVEHGSKLTEDNEFELGKLIVGFINHLDILMDSAESEHPVFSSSALQLLKYISQDFVRISSSGGLYRLDIRTLDLMRKTISMVAKFAGGSPFSSEQELATYLSFALSDQYDPLLSNSCVESPVHHLPIIIDEDLFKKQILLESDIANFILSNGSVHCRDNFIQRALGFGAKEDENMYALCCAVLTQAEKGFFASEYEQRSVFGRVDSRGDVHITTDQKNQIKSLRLFFENKITATQHETKTSTGPKVFQGKVKPPGTLSRKKLNRANRGNGDRDAVASNSDGSKSNAQLVSQPIEIEQPVSLETVLSKTSMKDVLNKLEFTDKQIEEFLAENERLKESVLDITCEQLDEVIALINKTLSQRDILLLLPKIPDLFDLIAHGSFDRAALFELRKNKEHLLLDSSAINTEVMAQEEPMRGEVNGDNKPSAFEKKWKELKKDKIPFAVRIASLDDRTGFRAVVACLKSIEMEMATIYSVIDKNPSLLLPRLGAEGFTHYFENDFMYAMLELGFSDYKDIGEFITKHPRCFHPSIASNADGIKKIYSEANLTSHITQAVKQCKDLVNKPYEVLSKKIETTMDLLIKYRVEKSTKEGNDATLHSSLKSNLLGKFPIVLKLVSDDSTRDEELLSILSDYCNQDIVADSLKLDLFTVAKASFVNPLVLKAAIVSVRRNHNELGALELVELALALQKEILERNPQFKAVRNYIAYLKRHGKSVDEIIQAFGGVETQTFKENAGSKDSLNTMRFAEA